MHELFYELKPILKEQIELLVEKFNQRYSHKIALASIAPNQKRNKYVDRGTVGISPTFFHRELDGMVLKRFMLDIPYKSNCIPMLVYFTIDNSSCDLSATSIFSDSELFVVEQEIIYNILRIAMFRLDYPPILFTPCIRDKVGVQFIRDYLANGHINDFTIDEYCTDEERNIKKQLWNSEPLDIGKYVEYKCSLVKKYSGYDWCLPKYYSTRKMIDFLMTYFDTGFDNLVDYSDAENLSEFDKFSILYEFIDTVLECYKPYPVEYDYLILIMRTLAEHIESEDLINHIAMRESEYAEEVKQFLAS